MKAKTILWVIFVLLVDNWGMSIKNLLKIHKTVRQNLNSKNLKSNDFSNMNGFPATEICVYVS